MQLSHSTVSFQELFKNLKLHIILLLKCSHYLNLVCGQMNAYLELLRVPVSPHTTFTLLTLNVLPPKEVQTFFPAILKKYLSRFLLENDSSHVKSCFTSVFNALEKQQKAKNRNAFSALSRMLVLTCSINLSFV